MSKLSDLFLKKAGFSTIEAMVAIAILGIALMPLYRFQGAVVSGSARVDRTLDATAVSRLASVFLNGLTPEALAATSAEIGALKISWTVTNLHNPREVLGESGLPGRFIAGLVKIDYTVSNQGEVVKTGVLTRLSWQETSPFLSEVNG